jgi:hypothetical protein
MILYPQAIFLRQGNDQKNALTGFSNYPLSHFRLVECLVCSGRDPFAFFIWCPPDNFAFFPGRSVVCRRLCMPAFTRSQRDETINRVSAAFADIFLIILAVGYF